MVIDDSANALIDCNKPDALNTKYNDKTSFVSYPAKENHRDSIASLISRSNLVGVVHGQCHASSTLKVVHFKLRFLSFLRNCNEGNPVEPQDTQGCGIQPS